MSFLFGALFWKLLATVFIDFLAVNTERETGAVHRQGPERQQEYTDRVQRDNRSTQTGCRDTTGVHSQGSERQQQYTDKDQRDNRATKTSSATKTRSRKVLGKDGGRCTVQ